MCGVKKQTLFHYDDIGLLTLSIKIIKDIVIILFNKLKFLSVIQMLKEIGMSLTEIKEFFHSQTLEQTITLLTEKEKSWTRRSRKCNIRNK